MTRENSSAPSSQGTEVADRYNTLNYESENTDLYEKYLVKLDSYTTKGNIYHEKHINYLRGIAEILTDGMKYNVSRQSIGFYFDKVKNEKDKLYLGLDIIGRKDDVYDNYTYIENGRRLITIYVKPVLSVLRSYEEILSEQDVEGIVIGLYWVQSAKDEFITIWFSKQNVKDYFNNNMTLNELIIKSTITDTNGKQLRLTL